MGKIEFTPKQWVLVRDNEDGRWALAQFSNMWNDSYVVVGGIVWNHCIPYEGNEHLLGTTDDYVEPYKPKDGDFLISKKADYMFIYNERGGLKTSFYAGLHLSSKDITISEDCIYAASGDCIKGYRAATDDEIRMMLDALHKEGKDWNAEKKCIEDIWKPKDGDFVTAYNIRVLICRNPIVNKDYIGYDFDTYASLELHSKYLSISDPHYIEQLDIRPASEEEKQILLDALHKVGKEWDAEKKKVIKYKWKPKYGEDYFTLEFKRSKGGFYVLKTRWTDEPDDMLNLAFNLVFRTKEGAQKKVDKFNERLKQ